jgi:type IV pilus assembly protein PilV
VDTEVTAPLCGVGSAEANNRAIQDLLEWSELLAGAAETLDGSAVGAMAGARGCVTEDNVADRTYTVSVAWQGLTPTSAPDAALTCAADLYGDERLRRVVSIPIRIGNLN